MAGQTIVEFAWVVHMIGIVDIGVVPSEANDLQRIFTHSCGVYAMYHRFEIYRFLNFPIGWGAIGAFAHSSICVAWVVTGHTALDAIGTITAVEYQGTMTAQALVEFHRVSPCDRAAVGFIDGEKSMCVG